MRAVYRAAQPTGAAVAPEHQRAAVAQPTTVTQPVARWSGPAAAKFLGLAQPATVAQRLAQPLRQRAGAAEPVRKPIAEPKPVAECAGQSEPVAKCQREPVGEPVAVAKRERLAGRGLRV